MRTLTIALLSLLFAAPLLADETEQANKRTVSLIEECCVFDNYTFLSQLGLLPKPGA